MPLGLDAGYFEFALVIPQKYDFLFWLENDDLKQIHLGGTVVYFPVNEHYLDLSLLNNIQPIDPVFTPPFHIALKSYEIPPNCFLNAPQSSGLNDSLGLVSLGTFNFPSKDPSEMVDSEKYIVSIPSCAHLNQSIEVRILDSGNGTPVPITAPSYIIIKCSIMRYARARVCVCVLTTFFL